MRLVDLSTTLANRPNSKSMHIEYTDHAETAQIRAAQIGIDPADFPLPGVHMASEKITGGSHASGTHVDAPWHYGPTSEGRPARSIDEVPIEWFFGDTVVLDFTAVQNGGFLQPADIERALDGYQLKPLDVVLLHTGLDRATDPDPYQRLRQLSRAAAEYLLDRGVKVIGIDCISADRANLEEFKAGDKSAYFPAHMLGREREFCFVEMLTNLNLLPHHGFQVALFPIKIERGSGAWCRAVAVLPED